MLRFTLARLVRLVTVLWAVSLGSFLLLELLPGDQAAAIAASRNPLQLSEQSIDEIRADLQLDDPLPVRYGRWLTGILRGDLGTSYESGRPVSELIGDRVAVTVEIGVASVLLAVAVSVPLGTYLALRAGSTVDKLGTAGSFALLAIPEFLLAILLIYAFAVRWQLFPTFGWVPVGEGLLDHLRAATLPVLSLTVGQVVVYTRILRSDVITTLQEDFVFSAYAKGLPTWLILGRHALRPSLTTLMTTAGLQLAAVIGGAALVETIFALPGLGRLLVVSVRERDLFTIQALVLLFATAFVVVNTIVDTLYGAVDPRARDGGGRAG